MNRYRVQIGSSFAAERERWAEMAKDGACLAFQSGTWLDSWANTKGRDDAIEMLAVTVCDDNGGPIMALPLVRERGLVTRIVFADGGLSDYNAPILTRHAPQDAIGALALWRALVAALPSCDQILLERMPQRVGDLLNPLALLPGIAPSVVGGLSLGMPEDFDAWLRAKPRRYRMEIGRCARLFELLPNARFERVSEDRDTVMEALESIQRDRIATLGRRYTLDGDAEQRFYRELAANRSGSGILTALRVGDETAAALLGLRLASTYVMLRIAGAPAHGNISPARQLIVRTMEHLRADGVTTFDFGLGDYPYKRKLGGEPVLLCDLTASRSLTGLVDTARVRLKARLRASPTLHAAVRRVATLTQRKTQAS